MVLRGRRLSHISRDHVLDRPPKDSPYEAFLESLKYQVEFKGKPES